jgi:hypothetical protein
MQVINKFIIFFIFNDILICVIFSKTTDNFIISLCLLGKKSRKLEEFEYTLYKFQEILLKNTSEIERNRVFLIKIELNSETDHNYEPGR